MTHEEQRRVVVLTSVRKGRLTAHEGGRFGQYDLAMLEGIEDHESLLSTLYQCHHASPLRTGRGRTFY